MFTLKWREAAVLCLGFVSLAAAVSARAQEVDFSGDWVPIYHEDGPERIPGPDVGDYTGMPLNDAARMRADTYTPDRILAVGEFNCRQHGGDYSMRGLAHMRIIRQISPETGEATAFHTHMGFHNMQRTIYLDGRPHPSKIYPHTWQGFSTGHFEANRLKIFTDHLKQSYLRRNGVPASAERTFVEYWMRHGDILSTVTIIDDPVFLTQPMVRSQSWRFDPGLRVGKNPCDPDPEVYEEEPDVPAYLPGQNPLLQDYAKRYGISWKGVRGGAETMFPEFRKVMGPPLAKPEQCTLYCTCMNNGLLCPE